MSQVIKIKRSTGSAAPSTLASGELAYSKGSDTFYIGDPGAANTPIAVGGAIKNNAGTPVLATGITAGEIRSLISVDAAGTDNSTDVTLGGSLDYLTIAGQVITLNAIDLDTDVTGSLDIANGGTGATTAAGARTALGVDPAGTDNSTNVTLAGTLDYLTLAGQQITLNAINLTTDVAGTLPIANGGTGATTASAARTALNVDVAGTDNSTDVTLAGVPDYLTIVGQEITLNEIDLSSDVTGVLDVANGGTGASTPEGARTALGVDAAGTDNSTDVTLAGTLDYLTISGQQITLNAINVGTDVTGTLAIANGGTGATTAAGARTALNVDVAGTDNSTNVTLAAGRDYLTISGQEITLNAIDLTTDVTGSLPIANGGTGSTTATGARTALGLVIGTNVLAYDANLQGFVDTFTLPTSDASAGQVLTTDGNGNIGFSTVSVQDTDVNESNLRARLADLTENVTIGDATDVTVTTSGDLVVTGDLTVNGDVTTINTTTLAVEDNTIVLNTNVAGAPTLDAGLEIERGTSTNVSLLWNETSDRWQFTNDGSTFYNIPISSEYGDITSVQILSTDGSITGVGTGSTGAVSFDLEVGTIDGGTY